MVGSGLGVTLLPATTIERDVHPGERVVVRELEPTPPSRTVGLAWRTSSARAPAYRQLGDVIGAAARTSMAARTPADA
jgi:LysR family hydrogen peroxide-inducible transcriptional activator